MRRNMTILIVGALVAVLAIGGLAPAVSAHGGTDTQTQQQNPYVDAENATDARAQYMADWMSARMGPDGVEAFEQQTGSTVDSVAHAMAEHMGPQAGTWNQSSDRYGPGYDSDYQAPRGAYGPRGPGAHGPQMPCGGGYGMWGGAAPGYDNGGSFGPSAFGSGGYGPGGFGSGGYGPGGHGMGGSGMGGPGMHGGR